MTMHQPIDEAPCQEQTFDECRAYRRAGWNHYWNQRGRFIRTFLNRLIRFEVKKTGFPHNPKTPLSLYKDGKQIQEIVHFRHSNPF